MPSIPFSLYREKVLGCWLGKAVGGTLGGPVEGKPGPLDLSFYEPVPTEMMPNDDLDLQVVWLETLRQTGLPVERHTLSKAWLDHIMLWPDEYGIAWRNLTRGLAAPLSGVYDNGFTAGMGAAIRSELWACLAPGDPDLARALMREDACVDHSGEGVYAAIYLVTLQSAAFTQSDRESLLDIAAAAIPSDCRVARALADTRIWWLESGDWRQVRAQILETHGDQNFTDVPMNLAFTILGWLAGRDFGEAICIAVNCGADTDCSGATLGALLGLIDPNCIGDKWLAPIGRDLVLSPGMVSMHHADTLDEFTDQVAALALQTLDYYGSDSRLSDAPTLPQGAPPRFARNADLELSADFASGTTDALLAVEPLAVTLHYPQSVALQPGETGDFTLRIAHPQSQSARGQVALRAPDGWQIEPPSLSFDLADGPQEFDLQITAPAAQMRPWTNALDLRFECDSYAWNLQAGLLTTIPWKQWPLQNLASTGAPALPENAKDVEVNGAFVPLLADATAVESEFKLPFSGCVRFVVQAPRALKVWVDGELILENATGTEVPAIHRPRDTNADVDLGRGWHRITIAVEVGQTANDRVFVCLGDGDSWEWWRGVEWRAS